MKVEEDTVDYLLSAKAVRERAGLFYELAAEGKLQHFYYREGNLEHVVNQVDKNIRSNYPDLIIPLHGRWRHFSSDRLHAFNQALEGESPEEKARIKFELAIVSVLLDAGAGESWSYIDQSTGERSSRSEGLAAASMSAFRRGFFSLGTEMRSSADGARLLAISTEELANVFQVSAENELVGLEGRQRLLQTLGEIISSESQVFGPDGGRLGMLFDRILEEADRDVISAPKILQVVLQYFAPLWSTGAEVGGVLLGDAWRYQNPELIGGAETIVPFHKLAQWLSYSLVEPLEDAGYTVVSVNELTALAEYRNGGLLIDYQLLCPRDPDILTEEHDVGSSVVVEWRAMTIALIDAIAGVLRSRYRAQDRELNLSQIIEGGTWAAGREVAKRLRDDGSPPLRVKRDGTIF